MSTDTKIHESLDACADCAPEQNVSAAIVWYGYPMCQAHALATGCDPTRFDATTPTPRVWGFGDPEPTDCWQVRDRNGDLRRRDQRGWVGWKGVVPIPWEFLIARLGPVTELPGGLAVSLDTKIHAHLDRQEEAGWLTSAPSEGTTGGQQ